MQAFFLTQDEILFLLEVATEYYWLQCKQNWLLVGCPLSGTSVIFTTTTHRNSSCGADCHDDRLIHTEQKDIPGQGVYSR